MEDSVSQESVNKKLNLKATLTFCTHRISRINQNCDRIFTDMFCPNVYAHALLPIRSYKVFI